jgi:hypothetical protein
MTNARTVTFLLATFCLLAGGNVHASSLIIDTDYRIRGVSYTDLDFNANTSSDTASYYSQRVRITVAGKLDPNVEIGTKITALGVAGSTATILAVPYPSAGLVPALFAGNAASPYPSTDFTPYIENAYVKLSNLSDLPIDLIAGRQTIEYGEGLIVSDNGVGFTGLRVIGRFLLPLPLEADLFTAKAKENFKASSDQDLYGGVGRVTWKEHQWELGYFSEQDNSGTPYIRGANPPATRSIAKQFYDIRIGRKDRISSYQFEFAKQTGEIAMADNSRIRLDGMGYVASGELIGEKTKLGRVAAHALLAVFSGEDNPDVLDDEILSFLPIRIS